jgi:hypothetical protein
VCFFAYFLIVFFLNPGVDSRSQAIFLRNMKRLKEQRGEIDETTVLWAMQRGEQLLPADIEKAMKDSDIRPIPLHSLEHTDQLSVQLYFGPGFEDRLELEMEEMIAGGKKQTLSEEERRIRCEEATLFDKLSKPPSLDGVSQLMDKQKEASSPKIMIEGEDDEPAPPGKRQRRSKTEN